MRILYGVQATGAGHIARSRVMLPELVKSGIEVDFLFSGGKAEQLFDMQFFGDYRYKKGLTLTFVDGKVNNIKTVLNSNPLAFFRDVYQLDLNSYDLVLTDFEPITAWAAKFYKIPSIGLANQYALINKIPEVKTPFAMSLGIKAFAPVDTYLGIHWQRLAKNVLPPLTQPWFNKKDLENSSNAFNLIYLDNENLNQVLEFANKFGNEKFVLYTHAVKVEEQRGNVKLCPLSRTNFLRDLINSKGVICNTGFGLCTEAMQIGKKILTKPLAGQFEQNLNAQTLQKMRAASIMPSFDADIMQNWLEQKNQTPRQFPNTAEILVDWIKNSSQTPIENIIDTLWQNA